ncbi:hypothetical protein GGI35DRAFT_477436 [Trichoderma velutinum]
MVNELKPREGKTSQWFYEQYTLPDCQDVRLGDEESDDVPFYWINCQTGKDGLCKTAAYPIGSFAIWRTVGHYDEDDKCRRWTEFGAASTARINECWLADGGAGDGYTGGGVMLWMRDQTEFTH